MNKRIELFGKEIELKSYNCKNKYIKNQKRDIDLINIFIQVNSKCNANCAFCSYHDNCKNYFDIDKLNFILKELDNKIAIHKLNFTGGEPTLDKKLFTDVINVTNNTLKNIKNSEVTVNTNGINLDLLLEFEDLIDYIGLSVHHYNEIKNKEIFKSDLVASSNDIINFQNKVKDKSKIQMRCNLIKGYIDSFDEIKKYLDYAISLDVHDCGFVTLMPINDYCKNHQINFKELINLNDISSIINVNSWERLEHNTYGKSICKCGNYVYSNKKGEMCKFYSRLFCNSNCKNGILVFDGKNLRYGFNGDILI